MDRLSSGSGMWVKGCNTRDGRDRAAATQNLDHHHRGRSDLHKGVIEQPGSGGTLKGWTRMTPVREMDHPGTLC